MGIEVGLDEYGHALKQGKKEVAELASQGRPINPAVLDDILPDNSADVVINMAEISDSQRAQIEDIVKRKAEIPGENIIITPVSAE